MREKLERGLCADPTRVAVALGIPCLGVQRAPGEDAGLPFRKQRRLELVLGLGGQGGPSCCLASTWLVVRAVSLTPSPRVSTWLISPAVAGTLLRQRRQWLS